MLNSYPTEMNNCLQLQGSTPSLLVGEDTLPVMCASCGSNREEIEEIKGDLFHTDWKSVPGSESKTDGPCTHDAYCFHGA